MDVIFELFGSAVRVVFRFLFHVLFEGVIEGAGYLVQKHVFRNRDPSELASALTGIVVLGVVGVVAYVVIYG